MDKNQATGDSKFYFIVACIKGKRIQISLPEFRWKLNLLCLHISRIILRQLTADTYKQHITESTTLNLLKITKKWPDM